MEKITQLSQLDSNSIYNYADYLTWQLEQSVELIHGKIFQRASSNRKHQDISWELSGSFYNFFRNRRCQAYTAPFDVRLHDKKKLLKANGFINHLENVYILCVGWFCDTMGTRRTRIGRIRADFFLKFSAKFRKNP